MEYNYCKGRNSKKEKERIKSGSSLLLKTAELITHLAKKPGYVACGET